ncbi:MAG: hypothetical protein JW934_11215 [Anaerolineae bacterium]|nr:hypothetical protein [Anaerolineae bacterium]
MKRIFNDLGMIVLALFLALVVWFVAVQEENPIRSGEFGQSIAVGVRNQPESTTFYPKFDQSTKLTIRAPESSWANLRADMFSAWVDLTDKPPEDYEMEVSASCVDKNVTIVRISPATVPISLARESTRTMSVTLQINVPVAFGYELKQDLAAINPITVQVRGPEKIVAQVDRVLVSIDQRNEVKETVSVSRMVVVLLQDGSSPGNFVTVQPSMVNVVVPVEQKTGFKDVAVRPMVTGVPAAGYRLRGISVEPSIVTLGGDSAVVEAVAEIGYVENIPLNIAGATDDVVERLALNLPEGASALRVQGVLVTASIEPIPGRRAISLVPIVQGLSTGLTAKVSPERVTITLNGPLPKLNTLTESDVQVYVELVEMGIGEHTIDLTFLVPEGIEVESIVPASVEVTIASIPPTPTPTSTPTSTPTPTPSITRTITGTVTVTLAPLTATPVRATPTGAPTPVVTPTPRITPTKEN